MPSCSLCARHDREVIVNATVDGAPAGASTESLSRGQPFRGATGGAGALGSGVCGEGRSGVPETRTCRRARIHRVSGFSSRRFWRLRATARLAARLRRHYRQWVCRIARAAATKPACRTPISEAGQRIRICAGRAREATLEKSDLCGVAWEAGSDKSDLCAVASLIPGDKSDLFWAASLIPQSNRITRGASLIPQSNRITRRTQTFRQNLAHRPHAVRNRVVLIDGGPTNSDAGRSRPRQQRAETTAPRRLGASSVRHDRSRQHPRRSRRAQLQSPAAHSH